MQKAGFLTMRLNWYSPLQGCEEEGYVGYLYNEEFGEGVGVHQGSVQASAFHHHD